jgi:hypothetical protein
VQVVRQGSKKGKKGKKFFLVLFASFFAAPNLRRWKSLLYGTGSDYSKPCRAHVVEIARAIG